MSDPLKGSLSLSATDAKEPIVGRGRLIVSAGDVKVPQASRHKLTDRREVKSLQM